MVDTGNTFTMHHIWTVKTLFLNEIPIILIKISNENNF